MKCYLDGAHFCSEHVGFIHSQMVPLGLVLGRDAECTFTERQDAERTQGRTVIKPNIYLVKGQKQ